MSFPRAKCQTSHIHLLASKCIILAYFILNEFALLWSRTSERQDALRMRVGKVLSGILQIQGINTSRVLRRNNNNNDFSPSAEVL